MFHHSSLGGDFIFTPKIGEDEPILPSILFSNGLVKNHQSEEFLPCFFGGQIHPRVEELPEDLTIFWRTGISANSFIWDDGFASLFFGQFRWDFRWGVCCWVVVSDIFYFQPYLGK